MGNERIWEPDTSKHLETLKDWVSGEVEKALDYAVEKGGFIYLSANADKINMCFSSGIDKPGDILDSYIFEEDLYIAAISFLNDYSGLDTLGDLQRDDLEHRVSVFEKIAKEGRTILEGFNND